MISLAYSRSAQRITCPHRDAVAPTGSITLTIMDDGGTALLSAAASTGSCSTTIASAASAGARTVYVSSATSLSVGEDIGITTRAGIVEIHHVNGVVTSTGAVDLRDHVRNDLSTSDTVKSAHIYYDADLSDTTTWPVGLYYQARFACSSWDSTRSVVFRVVKDETKNPITYDDVDRVLAHVSLLQDSYDESSLERPRTLAWDMISARLLASGKDPSVLKDTTRLARAGGMLAAALYLVTRHGGQDLAHELAGSPVGSGGVYGQHLEAILQIPAWYDTEQDGDRERDDMMFGRRSLVRRGL